MGVKLVFQPFFVFPRGFQVLCHQMTIDNHIGNEGVPSRNDGHILWRKGTVLTFRKKTDVAVFLQNGGFQLGNIKIAIDPALGGEFI